ncbi:hypothetical protein BDV96DRAFT_600024 [Lophiotrema nucula]|uniref:Uncharacterized protein n=1 Tax=Lophiotrema nucula TaxID=690887 RepID=A0A6A5Z747_9PLEO|nr:hypothetical protein BDV96DRAFT_600024 [Lophiotrema nucula]
MSGVPVIVCGRRAVIASAVREALSPDYEVIHVITSPEQGASEIPLVLSGKQPPDSSENPGSQDYSRPAVAVVTGGGYDDATFSNMKDACKAFPNVPWLRPDMSKMKDMPPGTDPKAYAKASAARVKEMLDELGVGRKKTDDGTYIY